MSELRESITRVISLRYLNNYPWPASLDNEEFPNLPNSQAKVQIVLYEKTKTAAKYREERERQAINRYYKYINKHLLANGSFSNQLCKRDQKVNVLLKFN